MSERNWARNVGYRARRVHRPTSLEQLQQLVSQSDKIRALGSRHSFSRIADTDGELIDVTRLPPMLELDSAARTVTVNAGARYGEFAPALDALGWALQNLASLPHITVGGSVATGTHGSGDANRSLAAAVAAVEFVRADGELQRLARGDHGFAGAVVNLGALGVMTAVTLDVVPAFDMQQDVYVGISWDAVLSRFDELTAAAYSVSLFTRWADDDFGMAWLKSVEDEAPHSFADGTRLDRNIGLAEGSAESTTEQRGVRGRWFERLPHFKLDFTPSNGDELQSEYLVPRPNAPAAIEHVRELASVVAPLLYVSEIRTVAADDLWLSGAFGTPAVGLHFTWKNEPSDVAAVLPALEERLLPLGARPHWGKIFAATELGPLYPKLDSFRALAAELDPLGKLRNSYLDALILT